ncbi:MAG: hypothetical protein ABFD79_09985 [Phycisphaerales bacterium]
MNPKTVKDNILSMLNEIETSTIELLTRYSRVKPVNDPYSSVVFINIYGNYSWDDLPGEGKQLQLKTLKLYQKFHGIISVLLKILPENALGKSKEYLGSLKGYITQDNCTWASNIQSAVENVKKQTFGIHELLNEYYGANDGKVYLVADTNIFISFPVIDKWQIDSIEHFCIVLTPMTLPPKTGPNQERGFQSTLV